MPQLSGQCLAARSCHKKRASVLLVPEVGFRFSGVSLFFAQGYDLTQRPFLDNCFSKPELIADVLLLCCSRLHSSGNVSGTISTDETIVSSSALVLAKTWYDIS